MSVAQTITDLLCTKFVLASTAYNLQKAQSIYVEQQHGALHVERQYCVDK